MRKEVVYQAVMAFIIYLVKIIGGVAAVALGLAMILLFFGSEVAIIAFIIVGAIGFILMLHAGNKIITGLTNRLAQTAPYGEAMRQNVSTSSVNRRAGSAEPGMEGSQVGLGVSGAAGGVSRETGGVSGEAVGESESFRPFKGSDFPNAFEYWNSRRGPAANKDARGSAEQAPQSAPKKPLPMDFNSPQVIKISVTEDFLLILAALKQAELLRDQLVAEESEDEFDEYEDGEYQDYSEDETVRRGEEEDDEAEDIENAGEEDESSEDLDEGGVA